MTDDEEIIDAEAMGGFGAGLVNTKTITTFLLAGILLMFVAATVASLTQVRSDRPVATDEDYNPDDNGLPSQEEKDQENLFKDQKSWDSRDEFGDQMDRYMEIVWNIGFLGVAMALLLGGLNAEFPSQTRMGFIISFALLVGFTGAFRGLNYY